MTHVIMVAFEVEGTDWKNAQTNLMATLPTPWHSRFIECWWIAEDERYDGSDNDSAVFVPIGTQEPTNKLINYMKESADQAIKLRPF